MNKSICDALSIRMVFLIVTAIIAFAVLSPDSSAGTKGLEFSVSMEKQRFVRCENVWVYFKVKNLSDKAIVAPVPVFDPGPVTMILLDANGDTISLGTGLKFLPPVGEAGEWTDLDVTLLPGDSSIDFVNLAGYHGSSQNPLGGALCHLLGKFTIDVKFEFDGSRQLISYEVVEPSENQVEEFRAFMEVDKRFASQDKAGRDREMDSFLAKYPISVFAPNVFWQKAVAYGFSEVRTKQGLQAIADDAVRLFPNNPVSNQAVNAVILQQTVAENEVYLRNLSSKTGTLISILAKQKFALGGFRRLSKDAE